LKQTILFTKKINDEIDFKICADWPAGSEQHCIRGQQAQEE
jgi:hypothetical protein